MTLSRDVPARNEDPSRGYGTTALTVEHAVRGTDRTVGGLPTATVTHHSLTDTSVASTP